MRNSGLTFENLVDLFKYAKSHSGEQGSAQADETLQEAEIARLQAAGTIPSISANLGHQVYIDTCVCM